MGLLMPLCEIRLMLTILMWILFFFKYMKAKKKGISVTFSILSNLIYCRYIHEQCLYGLLSYLCSQRYEVQIQACTLLGCASSEWASTQTLEAPPELQPAPLIEVQMSPDGLQSVCSVLWTGPQQLNGKILHYELYRRLATHTHINLDLVLVYNGSLTSCKDVSLLPYTEYEYQVWNGISKQVGIYSNSLNFSTWSNKISYSLKNSLFKKIFKLVLYDLKIGSTIIISANFF